MCIVLFSRRLVIGTVILACHLLKEMRELGWVPSEGTIVIVVRS